MKKKLFRIAVISLIVYVLFTGYKSLKSMKSDSNTDFLVNTIYENSKGDISITFHNNVAIYRDYKNDYINNFYYTLKDGVIRVQSIYDKEFNYEFVVYSYERLYLYSKNMFFYKVIYDE